MTETQRITERICKKYEAAPSYEEKPMMWPQLSYAAIALRLGVLLIASLGPVLLVWALIEIVIIAF